MAQWHIELIVLALAVFYLGGLAWLLRRHIYRAVAFVWLIAWALVFAGCDWLDRDRKQVKP